MLAVCPHCHTVFRIGAHELKVAHGQVQCGICLALFNALEFLHDEDQLPSLTSKGEPQPLAARPIETEQGPAISNLGAAAAELDMPDLSGRRQPDPVDRLPALMLSAADRGWPAAEEKEGRRIRSFWVAGALVLVIGIGIQYTWFQRSTLLERYPDLRPPLEQLCGLFRCKLPLRRDLQAVRLLSRDVRPHPRYQDSLLINATLVNEASFAQPYPVLQLEFSDVSGTKLIARRFKPMEYLDKNIKIDEGMPPGSPVHIVIELQGLKQTPVSYEFKFL